MGWNTVEPPAGSRLFAGSSASGSTSCTATGSAGRWSARHIAAPMVTWAEHGGDRFVAAVEDGPVWSTQFHPEKSGDAGAALIAQLGGHAVTRVAPRRRGTAPPGAASAPT